MKILAVLIGLCLVWCGDLSAQLELAPSLWGNHNQISSTSFDYAGQPIAKDLDYFNTLGKSTQSQNWDVITNKVWANQSLYDRHGRPALQTLSAPVGTQFGYSSNFILDDNNTAYTVADFDQGTSIDNPDVVGSGSKLRTYYSSTNAGNPYQDITAYPFERSIYSQLIPGSIHERIGGNKINGEWKQSYEFSMSAGTELSAPEAFGAGYNAATRVIKTVNRDVHGIDVVLFADSDGNVLAAARSGNEESNPVLRTNTISMGKQGFVDIHIPKGLSSFNLQNPDEEASGDLILYDLISELPIATISGPFATRTVPSGFYRIAVTTPTAYAESESAPITVSHQINYYDYRLNSYDKAHRPVSSKQSLDHLEMTFDYNTQGQVLKSTSPDQGVSEFLYRKDGQIRFTQNSQQARLDIFSYSNYDSDGLPIEHGEFDGKNAGLSFAAAAGIVDQADGLADIYCSEVHHTLYNIPDPELPAKLKACDLSEKNYRQTFVAGNVSKTWTEKPTTSATWYSYDVMGRVRWIIQEIPGLSCLKTIDYEYDPATGQIVKVDYQRYEKEERFIHQYTYNKAGKLLTVNTSADNGENFLIQAEHFYKETGEVSRTVLAKDLQGIDYVYNLNGQLKAINHPSLEINDDPGRDGANGIKADVFGLSLDYYNGDYLRPNTPTPVAQKNTHGENQYNGNIKSLRFNTKDSPSRDDFNTYHYNYNKNNWLAEAKFGSGSISPISNGRHQVNFAEDAYRDYWVDHLSYDPNGNLQSLKRNGYTSEEGDNDMDDFTYHYDNNNQLQRIEDTGDNADANRYNDLKNQSNNSQPNYSYNDIGQLISDLESQAFYEYNATGLVTKVNTFGKGGTAHTYYAEDFSSPPPNEASTWTLNPGNASINTSGEYRPHPSAAPCLTLGTRYHESLLLQMYDGGTATKTFDVVAHIPQTLSLNTIVYQKNNTGYTISILDENNTVLKTTSFNLALNYILDPDLSENACRSYYDQSESLTFTAPTGRVTLKVEAFSNSPETPIYLDNIEIETTVVPKLAFYYNDRGDRVRKETFDQAGNTFTTHYVRDVTGNVIAVYEESFGPTVRDPLSLKEQTIYGAGRLGILYRDNRFREGGIYTYQLTDHQGNVRAVLMKQEGNVLAITNKTDYYPFGMPMPGRQLTDGNYDYAFQGQEKDQETGMEAFELRLWDSRIGRWLTTDPAGQFASPYLGMGNNPVNGMDPDGGIFILSGLTKEQKKLWKAVVAKIRSTPYGRHVYDRIQNDKNFKVNVIWQGSKIIKKGDFFSGTDSRLGDGYYLSFSDKLNDYEVMALQMERNKGGSDWNHPLWVIIGHEIYHAFQDQYGKSSESGANKELAAVKFQNYLFRNGKIYGDNKDNQKGLRSGYLYNGGFRKLEGKWDLPSNYFNALFDVQTIIIPQRMDNFPGRSFKLLKLKKPSNCGCGVN